MLCTVVKLRSYIIDGKVDRLFASGCDADGWHLSFDTLSGKVKLRARRKKEPRIFRSGLALFKFVDDLGLPVIILNMKNKFEIVAVKLAALFMTAQINPDLKSAKDMSEAAAPAYAALLTQVNVSMSDKRRIVEYAMDYMASPALFAVGINSSIQELGAVWYEPLHEIIKKLEGMGGYETKFALHIKSINENVDQLR